MSFATIKFNDGNVIRFEHENPLQIMTYAPLGSVMQPQILVKDMKDNYTVFQVAERDVKYALCSVSNVMEWKDGEKNE